MNRRLALAAVLLGVAPAISYADAELGRKVFTEIAQPPCVTCHTLKDAGSDGAIGPVLDDLKPDAARVRAAVRSGVDVMPSYAGKLTDEQIEAVAAYVARATGAAK